MNLTKSQKNAAAGAIIATAALVSGCASVVEVATSDNPTQAIKDKASSAKESASKLTDNFKPAVRYQKALNAKGCEAGAADGQIGGGTLAAHARLEAANGDITIPKTATAVTRVLNPCK